MELKEGIVKGMDFDVYNSIPAFRSSEISDLKIPAKYHFKHILKNKDKEEKKWSAIGSALHALVLEPDLFFNLYIVKPVCDGRTKEGIKINNHFKSICGNKKILTAEDFDIVQGMANSIKAHPKFSAVFRSINPGIEDSLFWQHAGTGAWIKTRPDFYNDNLIVDIKTTSKNTQEDFIRSIVDFGYHRQAAMQIDGLSYLTKRKYEFHVLFVVEKEPPYLCALYQLSEIAIDKGREEYHDAIIVYDECMRSNKWRGYSDDVTEINLPTWYLNK